MFITGLCNKPNHMPCAVRRPSMFSFTYDSKEDNKGIVFQYNKACGKSPAHTDFGEVPMISSKQVIGIMNTLAK